MHLCSTVAKGRLAACVALMAAFAWSVSVGLTSDVLFLEDGRTVQPRLDLVLAYLPQGWPTLAALLWAPLVMWPNGRRESAAADRGRLIEGAVLVSLALCGGVALGSASALVQGARVPLGSLLSAALLLTSMLTLYLSAGALIIATGRFWTGAAAVFVALAVLRGAALATEWPALLELHHWTSLGRLGPGTMLEGPGIAAGVTLEPEWVGIDPRPGALLWLLLASAAAWTAVRWRVKRERERERD